MSVLALLGFSAAWVSSAFAVAQEDPAEQVKQLSTAIDRVQAQLNQSQHELEELRRQLARLQGAEISAPGVNPESDAEKLSAQVEDLREQQSVLESQVSVQEQTKVESESKFPVKVSGLVLMNGFVNTRGVDIPATPTLAVSGAGTTGASLRQTILGLDMRGPHIWGARSHADLRVDFDGAAAASSSFASGYDAGTLRLRTAHAVLDWNRTEAFFSLDRPIVSPHVATSLTAVAEPPLAWSGSLWSWNPQVGVTEDLPLTSLARLRGQFSLIDIADAPYTGSLTNTTNGLYSATSAEGSRWPGIEARIAALRSRAEEGAQVGIGGIFGPHRSAIGTRFDTWAGTVDYRFPLPAAMELSGALYRGAALGGLGGGAYKDYVLRPDPDGTGYYFRVLDDVGGWAQWKQRLGERLEFNEALGIDNVPAGQLEKYSGAASAIYQNLSRNRTVTGNVIYSPSAYLLFSLEYRRLESSPVNGPTAASDVIGIAAGYKF